MSKLEDWGDSGTNVQYPPVTSGTSPAPFESSPEPDQDPALFLLRDLVQTVGGKVEFWPTERDIEQVNITLLGRRFRIQLGLYDEIGDRGWLEVLHLGEIQREGGNK